MMATEDSSSYAFREASLFLDEGKSNRKFTHHPRSPADLPAYLLVHNTWFNLIDLCAALILLLLGFAETPCQKQLCLPAQIHAAIEIATLLLVAFQLYLKTRWISWSTFLRHRRTSLKLLILVILFVEAFVVLVRSSTFLRLSRAFRPIFLIDNYFCEGVRRFIRQILQSLHPILDMLVLVLFVMLIFSVFGFHLLGEIDDANFGSLWKSFISLFVLLTTANYPDVMMRSYASNGLTVSFFVLYLCLELYLIMNLMLAVVYSAFTRIEKDKFHRLFLHKRSAAKHAFNLLVTKERPKHIAFQHFQAFIKVHKRNTSVVESLLIFKYLTSGSTSELLDLKQFYGIYEACEYKWRMKNNGTEDWFSTLRSHHLQTVLNRLKRLVLDPWFQRVINTIVLVNGVVLVLQTALMTDPTQADVVFGRDLAFFFVGVYTLEAVLKLFALGLVDYFASEWNIFDLTVTILGICSLLLEEMNIPFFYVTVLRPLRLLSVLRMKQNFRDVFSTAAIVLPRLMSVVIVMILVYYFFAIVGMEIFKSIDLRNCCKNTTMENYYATPDVSNSTLFFYLNNFDNLASSSITLFELTVVNNWYVIMDGYAMVTGNELTRLFFMSFYIFSMIVMTIVVAFILEAFLFRMQCNQLVSDQGGTEWSGLSTEVRLTKPELRQALLLSGRTPTEVDIIENDSNEEMMVFSGRRSQTKEQLQCLMYADELDLWLAEAEREESLQQAMQIVITNQSINQSDDQNEAIVEVIRDQSEVTTLHRRRLPSLAVAADDNCNSASQSQNLI